MQTTLGRRPQAGALSPPAPRSNPVLVWGALGLVFAVLQVSVYVRWIASSDFKATEPGPTPLGPATHFWVVFFQVLSPVLAVVVVGYVIRGCLRARRFTVDAMIVVAWAGLYWLDPVINFLRPQFFYNSYLFNHGSWVDQIPGWLSPNGHLLPEPLIFIGPIYLWLGPVATFVASGIMRRLRQRRPDASRLTVLAGAWSAMVLVLLACELFFIRTDMYAYPLTIHDFSLFGGRTYQYPLFELLLWPMVWTAMGALRFSRTADDRTFLDGGASRLPGRTLSVVARTLAVLGYATVAMLAYAVVMVAVTPYGDAMPSGYPSYLVNGMCGPGTGVACPGPGVPIPLPGSSTSSHAS
jgi:hypothetical protein